MATKGSAGWQVENKFYDTRTGHRVVTKKEVVEATISAYFDDAFTEACQ